MKKKKQIISFSIKNQKKKGSLNQYKVIAEKNKGFIIGLENPNKKKI